MCNPGLKLWSGIHSTNSPSAAIIVARSCEVEAAKTFLWFNGVAVGHRAQRQLLLGSVVRAEPDRQDTVTKSEALWE